MAPVIGITTRKRDVDSSLGRVRVNATHLAYTDAVARAGGLAVLLPPARPDQAPALLDRLDGVILSGGGDVNPDHYEGRHHPSLYDVDDPRDSFEIALVRAARERRAPVLAICRGLQVANVALGGTLIVDLPEHSSGGDGSYRRHQRVTLEPGCRLAGILGTEVWVNSVHHQAVDRPAPGLRVVGRADDGVVEAVEHEDADWPLWAVQWHPELLAERDGDVALFAALVGEAGRGRGPA